MFGYGENREDGKQGEENKVKNDIFHYLVQERRREIENGEENFPSRPTFFYPPNLGDKWGGKSTK